MRRRARAGGVRDASMGVLHALLAQRVVALRRVHRCVVCRQHEQLVRPGAALRQRIRGIKPARPPAPYSFGLIGACIGPAPFALLLQSQSG